MDNTTTGKVTGWMRVAGLSETVRFDLDGVFHRDIRGTRIRLSGCARDDEKATRYMASFSPVQTGKAGDITAGLPPVDYVAYPYVEVYSEQNGRIVVELQPEQLEILGTPLPADECEPISRRQQERNMAAYLAGLSRELSVPAIVVDGPQGAQSDREFTHWVIDSGRVVGEAHSVQSDGNGRSLAFLRMFAAPEMAGRGTIDASRLQPKQSPPNGRN